ncbi:MAG: TonB family protein [Candidatus Sulfotelmatobacter sp.]|jgi:TonB family protein
MAAHVISAVLLLAVSGSTYAVSTPLPPSWQTLEQREHASRTLTRAAQFVAVPHVSARPTCEDVQPPQPLTTPDPLFTPSSQGKRIKVSFIIGTDGRVHSPLILESAGLAGDRHVIETVRNWRYRPATCNGIPTETEGKIEFSSR